MLRPFQTVRRVLVGSALFLLYTSGVFATAASQVISRHLPAAGLNLPAIGRLPATNHLGLAISLPLRNREALTNLLQSLYDPASPQFHHFLKPADFAQRFGPTEEDYQSVIAFARAHGLAVTGLHSNRTLVDVAGSVAAIERAFHVNMNVYRHPAEARTFFAADRDASLDLATPVLGIAGLHNYSLPKRMGHAELPTHTKYQQTGSGPGGFYIGSDYRHAYAPGVTLTGTGQSVALFELDGYYPGDITNYEALAHEPNVPITNVYVDNYSGAAGSGNEEVSLDIEIVLAMAPGLSRIMVYEGQSSSIQDFDDVLLQIAEDNAAAQVSSSWGFTIDGESEQIFQQYAAQGQSFFEACGDGGAYPGPVNTPADDPLVTCVGGTVLTTVTNSEAWSSETTWQNGGGGISSVYAIPYWQQGVSMASNQGSIYARNVPDVSMIAADCWTISDNGQGEIEFGTSISAPMWAGFTALANQQAALQGRPRLGLLNPSIYSIGTNANYLSAFHDITTGNNTNASSPGRFFAVPGYDLASGWGTPMGGNLINALVALDVAGPQWTPAPFVITAISRTNNNIYLTWNTTGGSTNFVQAGQRAAGGGLTTNFTNLSGPIVVGGAGTVSTNYVDAGGATNGSRYYRIATAPGPASDNAADPVYDGGWFYGNNGGTGFGPWIFAGFSPINSGDNGFYIGSSTNNGGQTPPGIDVNGKSWGIYAFNGNYATAYRTFNVPLRAGQTFTFSMDNGYIDGNGPYVGFVLRNGNATDGPFDYVTGWRFQFVFFGGSSDYQIYDNSGQSDSGIFFTDQGLTFVFTLNTIDTYSLQVTQNNNNQTYNFSGTLNGPAGGTIDSISLFNFNAGGSPYNDCFFNSFKVTGP